MNFQHEKQNKDHCYFLILHSKSLIQALFLFENQLFISESLPLLIFFLVLFYPFPLFSGSAIVLNFINLGSIIFIREGLTEKVVRFLG